MDNFIGLLTSFWGISVLLILIVYIYILDVTSKKNKRSRDRESELNSQPTNKTPLYAVLGLIFILLFLTLPFHYILYKHNFAVFPKNQMTFSNTYLDDEDIDGLIKRYNDANIQEKQAMDAEPLMRKLREKGIIVTLPLVDPIK